MKIDIRYLPRVEGHAHLVVDADRGEVRECHLQVVETPRYFESFLRGRHWRDVAPIVSRICGVCSQSHTLVSVAATEAAFGIEVSAQTQALRRLLLLGEHLQSHLLHLYFLAVPDYFGVGSIFPLARSHRELVARALRLKKLGNDICAAVGGRPIHAVTPAVGGFARLPEGGALQDLRRRLVDALPDLEATVDLFASLDLPAFTRETEYLCLADEGYPLLGHTLVSTGGIEVPVSAYAATIAEYVVPHSTAKFARTAAGSYLVGPLARIRNAFADLSPMARTVAEAVGLTPDTANPYRILLARLVEVVQGAELAIQLIDRLLIAGLKPEVLSAPTGGGSGTAAVEAPRGTLIHAYRYDRQGCIEKADCIIPTAQNQGNLEADLRALVPTIIHLPEDEVTRRIEMLVRAYDLCISCSTHALRVEFV